MSDAPAVTARRSAPTPENEPVRAYAPGTADRDQLKSTLATVADARADVPLVIGGVPVRSGDTHPMLVPSARGESLGVWHAAGPRHVRRAAAAAREAQREWGTWAWEDRAAVFLKAADLAAGPWRATLNATTMLGQGKTVVQAEIDAACELVDFWRFNVAFAAALYAEQPRSVPGVWNQLDYRPLEGFIYAVTPFNFTSIAGNLPTAPVLMGGVALWKPSATAMASAHVIMSILTEAGLPPGVINFVPGDPATVTAAVLAEPDMAGIHFTGSTAVFRGLWQAVAQRIDRYRTYPRLVGETGGKDFIVVHPSADLEAVAVAVVRGGFEYQGQKCSAPSRIYVPASRWKALRDRIVSLIETISMGDVRDFSHLMSAVIDQKAFTRIARYQTLARRSARVIVGGGAHDRDGFFVEPTLVETTRPDHRLLREEIFGPLVTAYVYRDAAWSDTLRVVDQTSPYALTGAVFARDRAAIHEAAAVLRQAAGNFYVNDKPTGAVVGQQPFGGGRASGTNDKAGSALNLTRWVSARAIKETFDPPRRVGYPAMTEP